MEQPVEIDAASILAAINRRAQSDPLVAAVLDAAMWEAAYRATAIPDNGNEAVEQGD